MGKNKLVPMEPTEAMIAAAPAVQGEPVAWIIRHPRFCGKFTDDKETAEYWESKEQGCTAPLYTAPQPTEQQSINPGLAFDAANHLTNWLEMDICECEGGHYCGYNEVKRTRDALLEAAEQPAPDVAVMVMVRALERIANMGSMSHHSLESAKITARNALDVLAAHRKQGADALAGIHQASGGAQP